MVSDAKKKGFIESFSNFMSDTEGLSREDLIAELNEDQIDIAQLKFELAEVLKRGSEERRLSWKSRAKKKMEEIEILLERVRSIQTAGANINKITEFIKNSYGPGAVDHVHAYFRNKSTLSEDDIIKLLQDLEQLNEFEKSDQSEFD